MVSSSIALCRKPGLGREEFIRYWAEIHAPPCDLDGADRHDEPRARVRGARGVKLVPDEQVVEVVEFETMGPLTKLAVLVEADQGREE